MNDKKANFRYYFWVALCFILLVITANYYYANEAEVNAFIRFDDRQIIGHSKEEIIEKYGEFDKVWVVKRNKKPTHSNYNKYAGLYRVAKASGWNSTLQIYYYYWIFFSEDDIALSTDIAIPHDEQ